MKWIAMAFWVLCYIGSMGLSEAQASDGATLVDSYIDDFSTEKARYDSYSASVFWVYGSYPPEHPYLAYALGDSDANGLIFRGYEQQPALLAYHLPISPDTQYRCGPMTVSIKIDFSLLGNEDPGNPRVGYLNVRFSSDGLTWSDEQNLTRGENLLEGPLEDFRYLKFKGMHAFLSNFEVEIYQAEPDIVVPTDYSTIQAAIDAASDGDVILVEPNYYKGEGFRNLSFSQHVEHNLVLMSRNGPDTCSLDCDWQGQAFVFNSGEGRGIIIDGFTIYNGQAPQGGAISCIDSSPTIANCVFEDNNQDFSTEQDILGGALYCEGGAPLVRDCEFRSNRADQGGGLYLTGASEARVVRCNFTQNEAQENGGAIMVVHTVPQASTPLFRQTIFCRNSAGQQGGAIYVDQALPEVINCTLYGNQAQSSSGGVICVNIPNLQTISSMTVRNCILWDNEDAPFATIPLGYTGDALDVSYCNYDVDYAWSGIGNISEEPYFASTDEGEEDFHLMSTAGRWSPDEKLWIFDQDPGEDEEDSFLCIDTGDPSDSVGAEGQPNGDRINMGAYGGTVQASKGAGRRVFHVDQAFGSDSYGGTSLNDAFATISKAIENARNGDAILVWPGVYEEELVLRSLNVLIQSAADAAICRATGRSVFNYFYSEGENCVLRNLVITGSGTHWSAIVLQNSSPTLEQLTIVENYVGISATEADPIIRNCIFWGNSQGDLEDCQAHYSCLEDVDVGDGNIDREPLFVDPNSDTPDYHLKSRYGRYWADYGVWVVDSSTSPCIDAGDPVDYPLVERQENGGRMNLGAYGGTYYASLSTPYPSADLNLDGFVDFLDLALLADSWLQYIP